MTKTALTGTDFSNAIGIAIAQVKRNAQDPEAGFLYAPIGEEPIATPTGRRRKFWAPWQVQLVHSVRTNRINLTEARQIFDDLLLTTTQPPTSADAVEFDTAAGLAS